MCPARYHARSTTNLVSINGLHKCEPKDGINSAHANNIAWAHAKTTHSQQFQARLLIIQRNFAIRSDIYPGSHIRFDTINFVFYAISDAIDIHRCIAAKFET